MTALNLAEANRALESWLRGAAFGAPPTLPIRAHLHTDDPGPAGTAHEVSGGSYLPQVVPFLPPAAGVIAASPPVRFPDMPAVTVTNLSLWDAAAPPRFLWAGALADAVACAAGETLELTSLSVALT